ncbi:MAG: NnrU family protein [Rhizobiaceae bacterium]
MLVLILGLVIFLGTHSIRILAPEWRDRQRAAMGDGPWRGVYSLASFVGFVLIVWGFGMARAETGYLYEPPVALRHVALLLMLFSFISLAVSIFPAGRLKAMLKHPMLLSVKIWAFAHLLANGETASAVLFVAVLAWAVIDRIALKRRGAPVAQPGPAKWDAIAIAVGIVAYALFVWKLHAWLIGVSPM